jgi:cell division protein FtsA
MGGGTTSIAVFLGGQLVHTEIIPIGGHHVTSDIARGLSTPMSFAERLKTLYGSAIPSPADDREMLKVPLVGESEDGASNQVARSLLNQIIQPRLEETFELVRSHLEQGGFDKMAGRRVVLTGGASQMQGVRDLAGLVLDKQVRIGRPVAFHGLPEATGGPAFSTCAGLVRYAMVHQPAQRGRRNPRDGEEGRGLGRIGQWLKKNF